MAGLLAAISLSGCKSNGKLEAAEESLNKLRRSDNEFSKHGNGATLEFIREWVKVNGGVMHLFKELVAVALAIALGYQLKHGNVLLCCFAVHMRLMSVPCARICHICVKFTPNTTF